MRSWSLLLITDLHYENPDSNFIDDNKDSLQPGLRDTLFPDYERILRYGFASESLDLIAIGGDITTHGKEQGFAPFLKSLGWMQKLVKDRQAICVTPGNHDVKWGVDPEEKGSFVTKFQPFFNMVKEAEATSCLYPEGELTPETDSKLALREPPNGYGPIYVNHKTKLLVMCINSAIRCGELNGKMKAEIASPLREAIRELQGAGSSATVPKATMLLDQADQKLPKYLIRDVAHVTQSQRNSLSDRLRDLQLSLKREWDAYLKVAIVHHHLVRFPGQVTEHRGYELLVDSGDVLSMLGAFEFDLVLTGHKHQAYIEQNKNLLIVGGPTVGGHSAGESFRGLRLIQVEDGNEFRSFSTTDIPHDAGRGNVPREISDRQKKTNPIVLPRKAETDWERDFRNKGFSYREMASITVLDEDGDARRTVECEDLRVRRSGIDRSRFHKLSLPSTSGYLAQLGASGKDFTIEVKDPIDRKSRQKSWEGILQFKEDIGTDKPASYSYQWYAVNAFAMDKRQFGFMYQDRIDLWEREFTHFLVEDLVEDFTLVVEFPEKFKMDPPPKVRVAVVDEKQSDSRKWVIDAHEQNELENAHALHYYASMNIAALRVKRPRIHVSYGIQWQVPPERRPNEYDSEKAVIAALQDRWKQGITKKQRTALLEQLAIIYELAFSTVLDGWKGTIDASVMYFDGAQLPVLVALQVSRQGKRKPRRDELTYALALRYGDGIGGRAFKTNRLRVYAQTTSAQGSAEPDYYTYLDTGAKHKVLVSMPVHINETNDNFKKNNRIYELKVPYGVFNLGSEQADCPLVSLRLPERTQDALRFQHDVNVQLFKCLQALFGV